METYIGCGHAAGVLRTFGVSASGKNSFILCCGVVEKLRALMPYWWTTMKVGRRPVLDEEVDRVFSS
jgi:hypothetical protein